MVRVLGVSGPGMNQLRILESESPVWSTGGVYSYHSNSSPDSAWMAEIHPVFSSRLRH